MTDALKVLGRMSLRAVARIYWLVRNGIVRSSRYVSRNFRSWLPVILDVSAFIVIVIGVSRLFGEWAWLVAGLLLILAGLRAES